MERSLVGYIVHGGHKESDMTERTCVHVHACARAHARTHTHTHTHTHTPQMHFAAGAPQWSLEMSVSFPNTLVRK